MDIIKVFGSNLKRMRLQKGLSQEKFAELCGLHRNISAILSVSSVMSHLRPSRKLLTDCK